MTLASRARAETVGRSRLRCPIWYAFVPLRARGPLGTPLSALGLRGFGASPRCCPYLLRRSSRTPMSSPAMAARLSPWHSLPSGHEGEHPSRTTLALPRPFSAARIASTASFPVLASSERRGAISCEKGCPLACRMSAGVDLVSRTGEAGTVRSRSHVSNASQTCGRPQRLVGASLPHGEWVAEPGASHDVDWQAGKGRGDYVSAPVSARRLPATTTLHDGSGLGVPLSTAGCAPARVASRAGGPRGGWLPRLACVRVGPSVVSTELTLSFGGYTLHMRERHTGTFTQKPKFTDRATRRHKRAAARAK